VPSHVPVLTRFTPISKSPQDGLIRAKICRLMAPAVCCGHTVYSAYQFDMCLEQLGATLRIGHVKQATKKDTKAVRELRHRGQGDAVLHTGVNKRLVILRSMCKAFANCDRRARRENMSYGFWIDKTPHGRFAARYETGRVRLGAIQAGRIAARYGDGKIWLGHSTGGTDDARYDGEKTGTYRKNREMIAAITPDKSGHQDDQLGHTMACTMAPMREVRVCMVASALRKRINQASQLYLSMASPPMKRVTRHDAYDNGPVRHRCSMSETCPNNRLWP
jgi:hypothetical protein